MTIRQAATVLNLLALAIAMPGCGGSDAPLAPTTTTTTLPPRSEITISFSSDPIIAIPSGDPQFPWRLDFRVRVTETAGLACNINQMIRTYKDRATGLELTTGTSNPDDIGRLGGGTNFLDARATKEIGPFSLTYRGSNNGRQLTISVTVEVIDARNNRFAVTRDVLVN